MATIEKKIWVDYYEDLLSGKKKYELRLGDFKVKEGDTLFLREWDKNKNEYTGRELKKKVTYARKFDVNNLYWPKEEIDKHGLQILSLE